MKKCAKFKDRIYLYHFGDLSASERSELEAHVAACGECAALLKNVKDVLDLTDKSAVPYQSEQFWAEYDASLMEKIGKGPFSDAAPETDRAELEWKRTLAFGLRLAPVFVLASVLLIVSTIVFMRFMPIDKDSIATLPDSLAPRVVSGDEVVVSSLEDELLLQELMFLTEMGEEVDLILSDEDLVEEMIMIEDIGAT